MKRARIVVFSLGLVAIGVLIVVATFRREIEVQYHLYRLGSDGSYLNGLLASATLGSADDLALHQFLQTPVGRREFVTTYLGLIESIHRQIADADINLRYLQKGHAFVSKNRFGYSVKGTARGGGRINAISLLESEDDQGRLRSIGRCLARFLGKPVRLTAYPGVEFKVVPLDVAAYSCDRRGIIYEGGEPWRWRTGASPPSPDDPTASQVALFFEPTTTPGQ